MARRDVRSEALLSVVRVAGQRWDVAMRDAEWERFATQICPEARLRLAVVLEHFCDHGERDLPSGAFRWLSRPGGCPGPSRQGAFEARGAVLRGHATDRMFFVTSVDEDPAPEPRGSPRRRAHADRRQLPLGLITPSGEYDGRD